MKRKFISSRLGYRKELVAVNKYNVGKGKYTIRKQNYFKIKRPNNPLHKLRGSKSCHNNIGYEILGRRRLC